MLLNVHNNVAMPQNQMAFKGGKFPPLITKNVPSYKPNLQRTREEFVNQIANRLEQLENSEVGKALKNITDRFSKKEITAEEVEKMIKKQLELIG